MTSDQQQFDDELAMWLERQEPPRSTDAVVDAVITRVSRTNQGAQAPMLFTAAAMAATFVLAVIVGAGLITQIRIDRGIGPSTPPAVREDGRHLPVEASVIQIPGAKAMALVFADAGGAWVQVESDTFPSVWGAVRIDATTNEVAATIEHSWGMAWRDRRELWGMVDVDGSTPCCDALPLSQIDPTTGAVLRTFDGVLGYDLAIDGDEAWITADELRLLRVNLDTGEVVAAVQLPSIHQDWEEHWVTWPLIADGSVWLGVNDADFYGPGMLVKVDTATNVVTATLPTERIEGLAYADGSVWTVVQPEGDILRVDLATATVTATLHGSDTVWGSLVTGADGLWTAAPGGVARIDPATNTIGASIPLPWEVYYDMSIADGELWATADESGEIIHFPLPAD